MSSKTFKTTIVREGSMCYIQCPLMRGLSSARCAHR